MAIRTRGLNHLTVRVSHLERSVRFYEQLLGFHVRHRGEHDAYLESGPLWLALIEGDVPLGETQLRHVDHIAFTIVEDAFDDAVEALRAANVQIVAGPITRGVGRSVYVLDPDGLQLELHTSTLDARMSVWSWRGSCRWLTHHQRDSTRDSSGQSR